MLITEILLLSNVVLMH